MVSENDFSGDIPEQTMSFNPSKIMIYKGIAVFAITIIAAIYGAGVIIANVMVFVSGVRFDKRLSDELLLGGKINKAIHQITHEELEESSDRLLRIETMLDPMYESITGQSPPARVQ